MSAAVLLLVNPAAGGGRAGRLLPGVLGRLRELGVDVRSELTRDLEHARELARAGALAGEIVACLSGDGMIGAVADCLRELPESTLGVLPGGRGNDFARVLGIPNGPLEACETIVSGVARRVDLGEVEGRAFVGIASVGFDSEANRIANQAPSRLGNLVYLYGALRALAGWKPVRFAVELEPQGRRYEFTGYTVGACNSQSYGGGMRAAPSALLDDGELDVVVLEDVSKLRFLTRLLPKVFSGSHLQEDCVKSFRASEVRISADRPLTLYADGDPIAELPARVRTLPGAVSVLVPAGIPSSALAAAAQDRKAGPAAAGAAQ
ncbi:MAG TPA: diacylglycerol kinase family protein [Solirubrobacteraceae bacterium]|nr:diacylglycerol kinase family protein [Solirubrobacteraceae bacterium]